MQSNFEKVYRHIHKDRLTSSKLLLSFIFRSFISTNKSTPCILFTIEDSPLKKKKGKIEKIRFQKFKFVFSTFFFYLFSFHLHPLRAIQSPIQPDPSFSLSSLLSSPPTPILFQKFDTWQGLISTGSPHKLCNIDRRSGVTSCSNFVFSVLPFAQTFPPKNDVRDVDLSCTRRSIANNILRLIRYSGLNNTGQGCNSRGTVNVNPRTSAKLGRVQARNFKGLHRWSLIGLSRRPSSRARRGRRERCRGRAEGEKLDQEGGRGGDFKRFLI